MATDIPKLTESRRVLREEEAARLLSIHVQTLRKWRRAGTGPRHIALGAKLFGYVVQDVLDWQEAQREAA